MEGMAEYLSVGPIDNHTAMWLRDASVEGHLPTLQQLSYDEVFPYYFGHAIWAYVGEKWGDDAVGQILQASTSAGVEGAVKRSEEHTSELQSQSKLVCRLLLEKK